MSLTLLLARRIGVPALFFCAAALMHAPDVNAQVCGAQEHREIDFETDAAGNPLPVATIIQEQWAAWGVHVRSSTQGAGPNSAPSDSSGYPMIFDSSSPTCGDPDLGTPNEDFFGPGVGDGGESGEPGENNIPRGNLLIAQNDQSSCIPNDDANGNIDIIFTFDTPTPLVEITFVDVDEGGDVTQARAYNNGVEVETVLATELGDNAVEVIGVNIDDPDFIDSLVVDFGGSGSIANIVFCDQNLGTIGDRVWHDDDQDQIQDAGESGFAGIPIRLIDTDANPDSVVAVDTTDANGFYLFTQLPPGNYLVDVNQEFLPPGFFSTTNNDPFPYTLPSNTVYLDADFGYDNSVPPGQGYIGDLVWYDHNSDGVQDDVNMPLANGGSEFGLPFAALRLYDGSCDGSGGVGAVIDRDTTDSWGYYLFGPVPAGNYCIEVDETSGIQAVVDFILPIYPSLPKSSAAAAPTTPMYFSGDVPSGGADLTLDYGFDTGSALPVELVSFDGIVDGADVELIWSTASEIGNAGFEIQWATDGATHYEVIGFVEGAGNTQKPRDYSYRVSDVGFGTHRFRLRQIDFDGTFDLSPVVEIAVAETPDSFVLEPVYPNPFNPVATVTFGVKVEQPVRIVMFDALGRMVQTLFEGTPAAGRLHRVTIDGSGLPSGIYQVMLTGGGNRAARTVTLLK